MNTFNDYSRYYDLLYKDKNYTAETEYIISFIKKYNTSAQSILDLGCGTGTHLSHFVERNYTAYGVDLSAQMIELAKKKNPLIPFLCDDISTVRLNQKFDVVTSLFHVISYQVENRNLYLSFKTAYDQLNNGGLFIFDCWYGPAVLTDRPAVRVKHLEDEHVKIIRISEPTMYPNENVVDVNFNIVIIDKCSTKTTTLNEKHKLRYLFKPEVVFILNSIGFEILECVAFMNDNTPSFDSWNVLFVAVKK